LHVKRQTKLLLLPDFGSLNFVLAWQASYLIPLMVARQFFRRYHQIQFIRVPDDRDQ
jgi:hypothetical protein